MSKGTQKSQMRYTEKEGEEGRGRGAGFGGGSGITGDDYETKALLELRLASIRVFRIGHRF